MYMRIYAHVCTCEYIHLYAQHTYTCGYSFQFRTHSSVCTWWKGWVLHHRTEEINDNFMLNKAFSFHREAHTKHISQMENHIQWAVQWTVSPTTSRLQMHVFAGMRQPGSIYPSMKAKGIIVKCDLREARAIRNQDFLTCLLYLNGIILLVF